jgi:GT2 family glycosyltransferase
MRSHEELHLARILEECATRLRDGHAEIGRGDGVHEPGGAREEQFAELETVVRRIVDVEHALREDVARRTRRSMRTRLRHWLRPRIGILRHHLPEQLTVPTSYLRATPPADAPALSIVTPSYEQGRYLGRTIYSVVNQGYPRLEYFVQDGGSEDETRETLERFEDSLSGWSSEADDGQADAINRGFAHTSGEIMAYLNSDDLLLPGSLAYVARYFVEHPDVDAIYGNRVLIDEHDRQIGVWVLPAHDDEMLTLADYVPQETLFWRRALWERAGGYIDASLRFAIDWDLLLRFRDAGARIVHVPRFLGAFRVHDEQKTGNQERLCQEESARLQLRVLGRAMGDEEIHARLQPYLRRHVLHHTLHRLKSRLPLPRSDVRSMSLEEARAQQAVSAFDRR